MTIRVRRWKKEDELGVKKILKEAAFSNVWPGFMLTLSRQWFRLLTVSITVLVISYTQSSVVYMSTVFMIVLLTYLTHLSAACVYFYGPPLKDMNDVREEYMRNENCCFWVAEDCSDHSVVGTIAIVKKSSSVGDSNVAWMRRMAVLKSHQNRGIAKQLVEAAIEFCHQRDYKRIDLITTEVHVAARNLYTKLGFVCKYFKPYLYLNGWVKIWTYEFEYDIN